MAPATVNGKAMGRPRKHGRRDLPDNLYPKTVRGKIYYQYRDPRTGHFHGLGYDKTSAVRDAKDLNAAIALQRTNARRDAILRSFEQHSEGGLTMAEWLDIYGGILDQRLADDDLSPNTRRNAASVTRRIRRELGALTLTQITTRHCAVLLDSIKAEGRQRTAQAVRSRLIDVFQEAIQAGEIDSNPAAPTKNVRVRVKRKRLTLETWQAIFEMAKGPDFPAWLPNAMLLSLLSSHARAEIAGLRFREHLRDGYLHIVREKTGTRIAIDTRLRLNAIDMSLQDAVNRCRDRTVSPWLIHHAVNIGRGRAGGPVHVDTISGEFARARDLAGFGGQNPPTFHEQRSLSERLYAAQGVDTQALLGHKSPHTTAVYHDVRGAEWIRVEAG